MTQDRKEWLQARKKGIGGSDVAAALGLSKWRTPYALWQDKTGRAEDVEDNEPMYWGRTLEPIVLAEYTRRTGNEIFHADGIIKHPRYDFMLANPDAIGLSDGRIVEAKTARFPDGWGEPGTDEVPQEYLMQTMHYMAVTGASEADVAVLIGGSDFRLYKVYADKELQQSLIEGEYEFWQHVLNDTPPEPITHEEVCERYKQSIPSSIDATSELMRQLDELKEIRANIKAMETGKESIESAIKLYMKDNDTLVWEGSPVVTWKSSKTSVRLDSKRIKTVRPDIFKEFGLESPGSRRFLVK